MISLLRRRLLSNNIAHDNRVVESLQEQLFGKYFEDIKRPRERTPQSDQREIGEYPDVPPTFYHLREPSSTHGNELSSTDYYDPQQRRQYGEPLPEFFEMFSTQNMDVETSYSPAFMIASFFSAGAVVYGLYQLGQYLDPTPWHRYNTGPLPMDGAEKYFSPEQLARYQEAHRQWNAYVSEGGPSAP